MSFRHNLLYIVLSFVLLQLTWPIIQYTYETDSRILLLNICFQCDDVPLVRLKHTRALVNIQEKVVVFLL